jgi:hypothetical protein
MGNILQANKNKMSAKYFIQTDVRATNLWYTLNDAQRLNKVG